MKIGDEVYVHGFVDEIRKDTIIIRNDGGYFGTATNEVLEKQMQESSENCISRQAVYDTLTEYYHHKTDIQHKALAEALSRVPLSPSRPQWIPCSERLPEADERVLVTTGSYDYYVWDCMSNRSDNYFWEDESGFYHDKHEVIAWMPLPEPYKGGEQDG